MYGAMVPRRGIVRFLAKLCKMRGSVFPGAFIIAMPCAFCTAALKFAIDENFISGLGDEDGILKNSASWSGFTFLVGFLIVFRTSQAYSRFWDGCTTAHRMRAEWFDACSSLIALCKYSSASTVDQMNFQHILVRLFSMLHASALSEIEDSHTQVIDQVEAFRYPLLDARAIDKQSLRVLKDSDCRVELLLQWIQQLVIAQMNTGVLAVPAPLLARSLQELSNGVVAFRGAMKISTIPFPHPYAQTCDILLLMHWLGTPFVTSGWVSSPWWGAIFAFTQVFVYWCLNLIATEIENPFGRDPNDIDGEVLQMEMNRNLLLLLQPSTKRIPLLRSAAASDASSEQLDSFLQLWTMDGRSDSMTTHHPSNARRGRTSQWSVPRRHKDVCAQRAESRDSDGNVRLSKCDVQMQLSSLRPTVCTPPDDHLSMQTEGFFSRGSSAEPADSCRTPGHIDPFDPFDVGGPRVKTLTTCAEQQDTEPRELVAESIAEEEVEDPCTETFESNACYQAEQPPPSKPGDLSWVPFQDEGAAVKTHFNHNSLHEHDKEFLPSLSSISRLANQGSVCQDEESTPGPRAGPPLQAGFMVAA